MKTRTGPLFFFSSLTPSSFPAVLPPLWALAVPKAQGRSQCVTAAKASIWTCWYAPPPPPHLSYLQKLPGDLHDLQGGGSSESRSDDEMRIIFSRSLWVHPWAAFKSVLICETNSEVSLTSSWPAGRGVAGRSPPRDCAFLSLSCNNVCQTGVVPICQPDSHHKNLVYIFHLCYHRHYKCFLRPEAHTRLAVPGFLFNKANNRLNNWGKVQICQTPWPQRCTSA